jgi:peptide deformylase
MALKIAQLGQPILRERAEEVEVETIRSADFQAFVEAMTETMRAAGGVGLAGPQVFAKARIFIASVLPPERPGDKARPEAFINPRLSELSAEKESAWEGCLSFLELQVYVPRHKSLRIDYLDKQGKKQTLRLSGFAARVVQHEYDHLEGILTIDRAVTTKNIVKTSEVDAATPYLEELR